MLPTDFRCFYVDKDANGTVRAGLTRRPIADLPPGEVLIQVRYSSLNFKDSLAAAGHPGVARRLPHIPGVDAAGTVVESSSPRYQPGDQVFVTGYEYGSGTWGGWAEFTRVPADWIVAPPTGLSLQEAMMLGTAGFTAAQCVLSLQHHGVRPESGEVVVTGATGGVGILAVKLLAQLGYRVVAVTGKAETAELLQTHGAARTISRDDVNNSSIKPLLPAKWAGGVDTVGGNILATLLRETQHRGCVAACGMVAGTDLPLTVYPFILRGITLDGIDSAQCPHAERLEIWKKLAGPWKVRDLESLITTVSLDEVGDAVAKIARGGIIGRVLVNVA